jgi:hypothetical protein
LKQQVDNEIERLVKVIDENESYKGLFKKSVDPLSGEETLQWDPESKGYNLMGLAMIKSILIKLIINITFIL